MTSMPSSTFSTQAGNSFGEPLISTRHSRHAPTSVKPFQVAQRGNKDVVLPRYLQNRLVLRALTSTPSMISVFTSTAVLILPPCKFFCPFRWLPIIRAARTHSCSAAMVIDVLHILIAEVAQRAQHRIGRGQAQPAETGVLHHIAQIDQQIQIVMGRLAIANFGQQFIHLRRARAARNALAAGLRHAELHEEAGHIDHAGGIVHDDHAARAHHRSRPDQAPRS